MVAELRVLLPEIVLLSLACVVLVVDLFLSKSTRIITYLLSQFALVATGVCCCLPMTGNMLAFNGQFVADPFSTVLKMVILILVFLVLLYSRAYTRDKAIPFGEFHALTLFSTLGMMILVSSQSLLMVYLGLELLSLPLYALVALRRDAPLSAEAGMKYFIMGALASGMLLYGMSLLFGLSGSIQLNEISVFLQNAQGIPHTVGLFALAFIIVGVGFKLGAAPFHMWIPDIYQGAPTSVTLLVASAPKIAAFGMAYRLLNETLFTFVQEWSHILIALAILSLALGNIIALVQTNVKRLFAYSTIAHIGYLFLGILIAPKVGYAPSLYYIIVYAIVATAGFGVLLLLSQQQAEAQTFDDLKGLAQRSPWLAFIMLLVAFSLAGVPPTVGFYAKFMILSALVDGGMTWLAGVAVFFSVIGAFYYLKLVRVMYFEAPEVPFAVGGGIDFRIALSVNGIAVLGLGLFPAPLFMICQYVLGSLL